MSTIALLLLGVAFCVTASEVENLKVCLDNLGCLVGTYMSAYKMGKLEAFMGIPYAKPPIGDLRFKNPEAITAWDGVLAATAPKSNCLQKNYVIPNWPVSGEEDCLYLNLYRPLQQNRKLPVLVYIHGGAFFSGSSNPGVLGPEYFMDSQEVILITLSYRLGPFGFLSTGDENMPGNFGLKDQNLAMKWVQRHCGAFGGDAESVTLFGHSVGASAVHFHMLSPASKGLFQRAIMISGSALAPFVDMLQQPREQAVQIAEVSGITNATQLANAELVEALRSIDATTLVNAGDVFKYWNINPLTSYRPIVESATDENAFLIEDPEKAMRNGQFTLVPVLMGLVSYPGESLFLTLKMIEDLKLRAELNQNFDSILYKLLELPADTKSNIKEDILDIVTKEYLQGKHELNDENSLGFMQLFTDIHFYSPFYKSVRGFLQHAEAPQNPLYVYNFNYRGPHTFTRIFLGGSEQYYGVAHMDDSFYLFGTPFLFPDEFAKNSADAELISDYVGILVEFMKNSTSKSFDTIGACDKQSFQAASEDDSGICNYLKFENDGKSYRKVPHKEFNIKRMKLWQNIKDMI